MVCYYSFELKLIFNTFHCSVRGSAQKACPQFHLPSFIGTFLLLLHLGIEAVLGYEFMNIWTFSCTYFKVLVQSVSTHKQIFC
jgi:hypothetical protein